MLKPLQGSTFAFALVTGVALLSLSVIMVARADKAKTPPPKDPAPKAEPCVATGPAKTAGKAFCAMDNYIRGRVAKPPEKMHATAGSQATTGAAVERSLGAVTPADGTQKTSPPVGFGCSGPFQWAWCRVAK
jgi:hypothetical protein